MNIIKKISKRIFHQNKITNSNKKYYRNPDILNKFFCEYSINKYSKALDIGSGPNPKNPFNADELFGVDLRENIEHNVVYADLSMGNLPFNDNSFEYITAFDVVEHIPRIAIINGDTKNPFIDLMNEIYRVMKINGIFFNIQPCYPAKEAFQDPTHVNIMSENTMQNYFCEPAWARIYGFEGSFEMINDGWIGSHYFSFIRKSFDKPIKNLGFIQK